MTFRVACTCCGQAEPWLLIGDDLGLQPGRQNIPLGLRTYHTSHLLVLSDGSNALQRTSVTSAAAAAAAGHLMWPKCSLAPAALALLLLLTSCHAQQTMPFAGNGEEPSTLTTVFVSSYIDRLMYIDDKNYEFQVTRVTQGIDWTTSLCTLGPVKGQAHTLCEPRDPQACTPAGHGLPGSQVTKPQCSEMQFCDARATPPSH